MRARLQRTFAVLGIVAWVAVLGAGAPSGLCAVGIVASLFSLLEVSTRPRRRTSRRARR